jgi:hypothetical protein
VTVSHPDPELLALAALPAEPDDPVVVEHLRDCARCRAEVADLRRTVELARDGIGDALPAPPPHVWQGIAAELGLPHDRNGQVHVAVPRATDPWPVDEVTRPRGPARPPGRPAARRVRRVLVPLLAAVVGLVVGLGIGRVLGPDPAASAPVAEPVGRLAPVGDLDPTASGSVAMADDGGQREMIVQVQGVTDIAGGDHLEAWLMDASGTRLVPLGALAGADGDFRGTFAVPDGLPLGEFGRVDVSAERWDGDPGHSTVSLLRGDCCS